MNPSRPDIPDLDESQMRQSVPAPYAIRTEEDLIRYIWVYELEYNANDFVLDDARPVVEDWLRGQLYDLAKEINTDLDKPDDVPLLMRVFDAVDPNQLGSATTQMNLRQLFEVYGDATDAFGNQVERQGNFDDYATLSELIRLFETGRASPENVYQNYQTDLAVEDWLSRSGYETGQTLFDDLFNQIVDFVHEASRFGIRFDQLPAYYPPLVFDGNPREITTTQMHVSRDAVVSSVRLYLGENDTYSDLLNLATELERDYQAKVEAGLSFSDVSMEMERWLQSLFEQFNDRDVQGLRSLTANAEDYLAAESLDRIRAVAFDPLWNPAHDAVLFEQLKAEIEKIPDDLFGVSIGWVRDDFMRYYRAELQLHQWRIDLKDQVELIEQEMRIRQDEEPNPWWWVSFVVEIITELAVEIIGGEAIVFLYQLGRGNYVDAIIELIPFDVLLKGARRGVRFTDGTNQDFTQLVAGEYDSAYFDTTYTRSTFLPVVGQVELSAEFQYAPPTGTINNACVVTCEVMIAETPKVYKDFFKSIQKRFGSLYVPRSIENLDISRSNLWQGRMVSETLNRNLDGGIFSWQMGIDIKYYEETGKKLTINDLQHGTANGYPAMVFIRRQDSTYTHAVVVDRVIDFQGIGSVVAVRDPAGVPRRPYNTSTEISGAGGSAYYVPIGEFIKLMTGSGFIIQAIQ